MTTNDIDALIHIFSKLPGLGPRSARRAVLHLIRDKEKHFPPMVSALQRAYQNIQTCAECGNMDVANPCHICANPNRDTTQICVVEDLPDLWAIERGHTFRGLYHVLGGTLSALDGRGPSALNLESLLHRAGQPHMREVILATNATIEGQTTAHYITGLLKDFPLAISQLAQGIPMGGELDYLDDGTLGAAIKARKTFA